MKTISMPRKAMKKVVVFGGNGFIGRSLLPELVKAGYAPVVVGRGRAVEGYAFESGDLTLAEDVRRVLKGAWGVVNLVGLLAERGEDFDEVHHIAVKRLGEIAKTMKVQRLVHVSAEGVQARSRSKYSRSKAAGELALLDAFEHTEIIRPGVVQGFDSGLARQIDLLTRYSPIMPLMGGGQTVMKTAPVERVVAKIVDRLEPRKRTGVSAVVDPQGTTFKDLVRKHLQAMGRKRLLVPVPWPAAFALAHGMEWVDRVTGYSLLPWWAVVTVDQMTLLKERD
ncbi:MAG: NAD-dependent epimerase/dehydratase family protein [Alphaproteobacteria bacterium]|nr:MAG: NAD-dependent epimerase/dehydratase family protein [Alphaproteobacteria bacterium]